MVKKIIEKYKSVPVQAKASFWFLVCSVMQRGISVITTPIFTRLLDTGTYGQYNVFNSWLDIISIFVTLRLYYGVFVQGLVKFKDDRAKYASSMQCLGLVLSLAWTIIYLLFSSFWNELFGLTTVQMLAMMVMIWAAGAFRFWAAEKRVQYKYKPLVILTLFVSVLKPGIGIFLVKRAEDKATARILGLALAEIIGYTGCFFVQLYKGKQFYSAKYWKHALMFNIPLIPHYLSQTVLSSADRIMIRDMIGASEAGIYGLAYSISKIMSMFNQALTQTLSPWMYQKIRADRSKDIASIAYPSLIFIASINLGMIAFAPELVQLFAPKPYYDAIWVIPPVAMSVFFTFAYHLFATFEFYFEKVNYIMIASIISAAMNIGLNYVLIPRYGYYAAGFTTLFCYMAYTVGHYFFMKKVCKEHLNNIQVYDKKLLLTISCVFLIAGSLFMATYEYRVIRLGSISVMIIILILYRRRIIEFIQQLLDMRKNRKVKA